MGVNRSGYYKWKARQGQPNRYERDRILLTEFLLKAYDKHPSHGYHRLANDVFQETGWVFSHHLAHQCCKAAGIRSKARKYRYKPPGEESVQFPNEVRGRWNTAAPLQIVVSDMTEFRVNGVEWEWTILLDTFNNEILAHSVTSTKGSNKPYYHCLDVLKQLMDKREEQTSQVVFHTDQGAVYSSRAFCQAHKDYNILRSMSRVGTPTDNPIIEALTDGSKKNCSSTLIWPTQKMFQLCWTPTSTSSTTAVWLPLWAIEAQFSTGPNWASVSCAFLCLLLLDRCTAFRPIPFSLSIA